MLNTRQNYQMLHYKEGCYGYFSLEQENTYTVQPSTVQTAFNDLTRSAALFQPMADSTNVMAMKGNNNTPMSLDLAALDQHLDEVLSI